MSSDDELLLPAVWQKRWERYRPFLRFLAILPAFLAIGIFFFIRRYQNAHDESVCPFTEVRRENVGRSLVREDKRQCMERVEEHRWVVTEPGAPSDIELGRYPLTDPSPTRVYRWTARVIETDRIEVRIENPGRGEMFLRSP